MEIVLAYLSPETYLPLSSVVATVVGVLMMFGKGGLRLATRFVKRIFRRESPDHSVNRPHFNRSRARSRMTKD